MLWIGVAIAAAFVLLLVVRAMGDTGKAAPATPGPMPREAKRDGGGALPAKKDEPPRREDPPPPAVKKEPAKTEPAKAAKAAKDDEEPEGTKVASVPPPPPKEKSVIISVSEVALDFTIDDDDPTGPIALILVSAVGRTDPGRRRKHNEDAYLVMEDQNVFVIADGMGGYAAGEVASQLAVDVISEAFKTSTFTGEPDPTLPKRGDELVRAIQMANTAILTQARANEAQAGMGTTIVSCRFSPNKQRVYIAHVGDSRCYRLRGDELKQMTVDHTLGAVGITGPAAAKLSRAVGIQDTVDVDLTVDAPKVGDHYILCSDGLSKMVPDEQIKQIIRSTPDLARCVERLVETANERGGRDNVSVILIHVEEPPKL